MKSKILIFGGSGLVGSKFIELQGKNFQIKAPSALEVDIADKEKILKSLDEFEAEAVINFAAFTNVEQAQMQKGDKEGICFRINAIGAKNVAEVCQKTSKHLIHISTEYVFDGTKSDNPYQEEDQPNPINWYGQTKYFGEQFVLESGCSATIVRISMPFSAFYEVKKDVARFFLDQLKRGQEIKAIEDQRITPTNVSDIAHALAILVNREIQGIYHICSKNSTTPFEFAKLIAREFNLDDSLIKSVAFDDYNKNKKAKLLKNSWLDPSKFIREFGGGILQTIEDDVKSFKQAVDAKSLN